MSYNISIRYDSHHSQSADPAIVEAMLKRIPRMSKMGDGYYYEDRPNEIYFLIYSRRIFGSGLLQQDHDSHLVNRVEIHIPGDYLKKSLHAALRVSKALAEELGWKIYDEHKKDYIALDDEILNQYDLDTGRILGKPKYRKAIFTYSFFMSILLLFLVYVPPGVLLGIGIILMSFACGTIVVTLVPNWRKSWRWGREPISPPVSLRGFLGIILGLLLLGFGLISEGTGLLTAPFYFLISLGGYVILALTSMFDPWRP